MGKANPQSWVFFGHQKHPHGCGEDDQVKKAYFEKKETPPREWGRPLQALHAHQADGNTPAGVGKTTTTVKWFCRKRKHPHGRGEDQRVRQLHVNEVETPPRVWGRLAEQRLAACEVRNTPTGVGKTTVEGEIFLELGKHLHGCGEDAKGRAEA